MLNPAQLINQSINQSVKPDRLSIVHALGCMISYQG